MAGFLSQYLPNIFILWKTKTLHFKCLIRFAVTFLWPQLDCLDPIYRCLQLSPPPHSTCDWLCISLWLGFFLLWNHISNIFELNLFAFWRLMWYVIKGPVCSPVMTRGQMVISLGTFKEGVTVGCVFEAGIGRAKVTYGPIHNTFTCALSFDVVFWCTRPTQSRFILWTLDMEPSSEASPQQTRLYLNFIWETMCRDCN